MWMEGILWVVGCDVVTVVAVAVWGAEGGGGGWCGILAARGVGVERSRRVRVVGSSGLTGRQFANLV